ncbi:hypothetical protein N1851_024508 [Merluccius polli]|uniref:Uncharacterized protein n=1 Tax=Merluccius polli TaxID=89951 RepID=A0AA47MF72_MERPO|nr:hypothetical protein N1851_024508 [Merluccius polli]
MQLDVKEPPVFRGDNSDKCSVREWVEIVEMYFVKRNIPAHQQSQDILARLMGKARDVVKVTLCHNPSLDKTPELIFDLLKQHFAFSELFYAQVGVNDTVELKGMIDSGSMTCTLIEEAECSLREAGVLVGEPQSAERIVLVGCGGKQTRPKGIYDLTLTVYGVRCIVPVIVVPGQPDELIIGSNVLKHLMRVMKGSDDYWKLVSTGCKHSILDYKHFLDMMSCTTRWRGDKVPDKIGTVKLPRAVTPLPQREHLVWGKLPSNVPVSPGSTIIVEPCTSKSRPRDILVGRVITPMWGDRWVPMKVTNLSSKSITLKRNSKVADVSPCLAVEDLDIRQGSCKMENRAPDRVDRPAASDADLKDRLSNLGLSDLDIDSCHASFHSKRELVELIEEYEDIFSRLWRSYRVRTPHSSDG